MNITLPKRSLIVSDPRFLHACKLNDEDWGIALAWCLHKSGLDGSFRLNKRKKHVKELEPWGHWLFSLLTLCKESHGLHHESANYANHLVWFQAILEELRNADLGILLQSWAGESITKRSDISLQRSLTADLADGINPASKTQQLHLWRLLEATLTISAQNPQWDKKFFRGSQRNPTSAGFVAAHRRFLRSQEGITHAAIDFKSQKLGFRTHGGRR
jgi:hypothetical protein